MDWPAPDQVHVWSVDVPRAPASIGAALSEDELLRAAAFRVEDARQRFVAARGALRILLGRYLEQDPAMLRFATTTEGKPRLDHPSSPLQFNLSHSGEVALIAIAGTDVGVDVEEIQPRRDLDGVARRVFTSSERDAIDGPEAFYRHWVAKEAFVKATGKGVTSVRSFEVLLDAPGGARIVHVGGDHDEARRWTLAPVDVAAGYAAALVARGPATVSKTSELVP